MVQENKNSTTSHSSVPTRAGFKKIMALMGLMTFSTLTSQAAHAQSNDTVAIEQVEKSQSDSIKNKAEYDAEYQKLIERWEELQKEKLALKEKERDWTEQREMLMGAMKALAKIESQHGVVTESDARMARGGLRILSKRQRLPELADLVKTVKKIMEYIANQPTQEITKN